MVKVITIDGRGGPLIKGEIYIVESIKDLHADFMGWGSTIHYRINNGWYNSKRFVEIDEVALKEEDLL